VGVLAHIQGRADTITAVSAALGGARAGRVQWNTASLVEAVSATELVIAVSAPAAWADLHYELDRLGVRVLAWDIDDGNARDRSSPTLAAAQAAKVERQR
jgi:hypothetical protein